MKRKTPTDIEINKMRELRRSGYSYGRISEEMGISRSTAYKYSSDIVLYERLRRIRSDNESIILRKVMAMLKLLLNAGVNPDDIDMVSRKCNEKLDQYGDETLFLLKDTNTGFLDFFSTVLSQTNIGEKYGDIPLKVSEDTMNTILDSAAHPEENTKDKLS